MSEVAELGRLAGKLEREGHFAEAERVCRRLLEISPEKAAGRYSLSTLLIRRGAWSEAWPLYEARLSMPEWKIRTPLLSFPRWTGEQIRSLVIWFEQGLGDQIMFARWIPSLVAQGVRVTYVCPPPLVRLLSHLGAEIIPAQGTYVVPRHDAWCHIGSLPYLVGGLPASPYIPGGRGIGMGVGVVPSGNPAYSGDALRSLHEPFASKLLALGRDLRPGATSARDLEDGAEIIRDLAEVIAVDTSLAHLAAAMGKPTTILLPFIADGRWGSSRQSALYPTATLIRQPAPGDWGAVFDQLGSPSRMRMMRAIPEAPAPPAPTAFEAPEPAP